MPNFLIKLVVRFLPGYKTIMGGVGLIALGVHKITEGDWSGGSAMIAAGLAALGLRGALDGLLESTNPNPTGPTPKP